MTRCVIVDGDDWTGFYKDGELILEGHSLDLEEVLEELGVTVYSVEADMNWLDDIGGHLPESLGEVKTYD